MNATMFAPASTDFELPPFVSERLRAALAAFAAGGMVVVTDDDGRENEGDLIVAASLCTPRDMAFIIRHTSGIVCAPMTEEIAARLELPPMVARNDAPLGTAFTVSVDLKEGISTGISAADRSLTANALADPAARPDDFVRPGHVFPLIAREGGVLERDGHTEAAVDLCRLTGLPQVAVICEMMNDDGTAMRGDELARFRLKHGLVQISIEELIGFRNAAPGFRLRA